MNAMTPAPTPGWYPDPSGSPQQRWWDGTRWTDQVAAPSSAAPAYPASAYAAPAGPIPKVAPETPVYNVFIWLIVLLPLLSLVGLWFYDFEDYIRQSLAHPTSVSSMPALFTPSYLLLSALSFVIFAATIVCAVFDMRALTKAGYVRPFHWAFAFISGTVYIIGRSVIVRRRSGRGLTPIWVTIGVIVLAFVVAIVKMSQMVTTMFDLMSDYTY